MFSLYPGVQLLPDLPTMLQCPPWFLWRHCSEQFSCDAYRVGQPNREHKVNLLSNFCLNILWFEKKVMTDCTETT